MRKIISLAMIIALTTTCLSNTIIVSAEETADTETTETAVTQEAFDVGMALPFTMLEAYLYAIAGEQAVETYYNDEENQEALHKDFCDFISDTSTGIEVNMKMNGVMVTMAMDKFMEYYKTNGSSALSGANEYTKEEVKAILTGKSPENNNDKDNNNSEGDKDVKIVSATSTALVTHIANYIDELVSGNRGEVSETFANGGQEVPLQYFDGSYNIVDNELYFRVWGDCLTTATYLNDFKHYNGFSEFKVTNCYNGVYTIMYGKMSNFAIYCDISDVDWTYNGLEFYEAELYGYSEYSGVAEIRSNLDEDDIYMNGSGGWVQMYGVHDLCFTQTTLPCIKWAPVFITKESLNYYVQTGDASGAINYFEGVKRGEDWFSYDFSTITSKLDELLKAFNALPLITTEALTGFVQGVNQGVVVGALPQAEPLAQQQAMEKLLEDNAKKVATEQLAENTLAQTEQELAEEYGATPKPTATPEKKVTEKQAKMMVDLHEFFPFCVPYDLVHLIKVLNAEPVAPCFETAIVYEPLNINVPVKLDLAPFEDTAKVFRITEIALFILSLILVSRSLIRG